MSATGADPIDAEEDGLVNGRISVMKWKRC